MLSHLSSSSLYWLYLDDIYFCPIVFTVLIFLLSVITGDNKNYRGRAESHFLLWPVPCFLRHNYWSYWFVIPCCWCLFHGPMEFHQAKAQELQKASSKLQERTNRMKLKFLKRSLSCMIQWRQQYSKWPKITDFCISQPCSRLVSVLQQTW